MLRTPGGSAPCLHVWLMSPPREPSCVAPARGVSLAVGLRGSSGMWARAVGTAQTPAATSVCARAGARLSPCWAQLVGQPGRQRKGVGSRGWRGEEPVGSLSWGRPPHSRTSLIRGQSTQRAPPVAAPEGKSLTSLPPPQSGREQGPAAVPTTQRQVLSTGAQCTPNSGVALGRSRGLLPAPASREPPRCVSAWAFGCVQV